MQRLAKIMNARRTTVTQPRGLNFWLKDTSPKSILPLELLVDQITSNSRRRIHLELVSFNQSFKSLGCVTAVRRAFIVFAKCYIRSKFQSCQIGLKLKIQSLLTLLL